MANPVTGERYPHFEPFFRALYPKAVMLAQRILGDETLAEDVAQEAFARAYGQWQTVGELAYRDAWVMRVTANLAVSSTRRRKAFVEPTEPAASVEDVATMRVALAGALRNLPRRQREAVVLRYLAGLSEDEVAAALELAAGTVRAHLHRGVVSLRRHLAPIDWEDDSVEAT
jgi:RNA polymerase sigma-70 factor (ECF subfamily)